MATMTEEMMVQDEGGVGPSMLMGIIEHAALAGGVSRKRKPSDDLSDQQRLAKRFGLLNIDQQGNDASKLYIPISPSALPTTATNPAPDDHMSLDETAHKVYIYDLDKELEGYDSDAERAPIFIPDIEKQLLKLPKVVLLSDDMRETAKNMQMVLYNVPSSLSVPEEQDNVRKAIMESRQRMRQKQAMGDMEAAPPKPAQKPGHARKTSREINSYATQRYEMKPRGELQVPSVPSEYLVSKASMNNSYQPDVMEMD